MTQLTYANIIRGLRNPALVRPHLHQWYDSLKQRMNGALPNPRVVKLYVNNYCNCHCTMCDFGTRDAESMFYQQVKPGEKINMTDSLFEKLLQEISLFHPRVCIAGVEPLLHPRIIRIVNRLTEQKLLVSLITNGKLLSGYAAELLATGLESITVSLDGPEAIHDKIRGEGTYSLAWEGLGTLQRIRKNRRATTVGVNCTITETNQEHLLKHAIALLDQEIVDRIAFTLPYFISPAASSSFNNQYGNLGESTPVNNGSGIVMINSTLVWGQLTQLSKKYGKQKIHLNPRIKSIMDLDDYFHNTGKHLGNKKCLVPWESMTILAHGEVVIHNRCLSYSSGNVNDSSLDSIWNGEKQDYFRSQLNKAGLFPICLRCCGPFQK